MTGIRLIQISALYMVLGLLLGLAMGISGNFSLTSVHAHILLLGWTTMAITGVVYLVRPACAGSRLASLHFWGHNVGLPVMMVSLAFEAYGKAGAKPAIGVSSTLVLISLLLFTVNLLWKGGLDRFPDHEDEAQLRTQATGKLQYRR